MADTNRENAMSDSTGSAPEQKQALRKTAAEAVERANDLRDKALARLRLAGEKAADVQVVVVERGKKAAHVTDNYVHDKPWRSIGVAAALGLLAGLLINRR